MSRSGSARLGCSKDGGDGAKHRGVRAHMLGRGRVGCRPRVHCPIRLDRAQHNAASGAEGTIHHRVSQQAGGVLARSPATRVERVRAWIQGA